MISFSMFRSIFRIRSFLSSDNSYCTDGRMDWKLRFWICEYDSYILNEPCPSKPIFIFFFFPIQIPNPCLGYICSNPTYYFPVQERGREGGSIAEATLLDVTLTLRLLWDTFTPRRLSLSTTNGSRQASSLVTPSGCQRSEPITCNEIHVLPSRMVSILWPHFWRISASTDKSQSLVIRFLPYFWLNHRKGY